MPCCGSKSGDSVVRVHLIERTEIKVPKIGWRRLSQLGNQCQVCILQVVECRQHIRWVVKVCIFSWLNEKTDFVKANIVLFFLALFYEGLAAYRIDLDVSMQNRRQKQPGPIRNIGFSVGQNTIRALMHGFAYLLSQILMMVFMAYNGFFCASLVFGRMTGFLVFSILYSERLTENAESGSASETTLRDLQSEYRKPCCSW